MHYGSFGIATMAVGNGFPSSASGTADATITTGPRVDINNLQQIYQASWFFDIANSGATATLTVNATIGTENFSKTYQIGPDSPNLLDGGTPIVTIPPNSTVPFHADITLSIPSSEGESGRSASFLGYQVSAGISYIEGCTQQAGAITANITSGIPGTTVIVTGSGWQAGTGNIYQIALDGNPITDAVQSPATCTDQPNITFDIPCQTPAGDHQLTCQLVSSSTQQVVATSTNSVTFTVNPLTINPLATSCSSLPQVKIDQFTVVPRGTKANPKMIISPSPSNLPITLTLRTTTGTGEAVFAANNSSTLTIQTGTKSGTESPIQIPIMGVKESSKADNIELTAKANGQTLATVKFTVLWVTISFRYGKDDKDKVLRASPQNKAGKALEQLSGSDELTTRFAMMKKNSPFISENGDHWRNIVELVGTVMPSDYTGEIILQRRKDRRVYRNTTLVPSQSVDDDPDTSEDFLRDDIPKKGEVYDIDGPGFPVPSRLPFGTIARVRWNFREFATIKDPLNILPRDKYGNVRVSDEFPWFSRLSVIRDMNSKNPIQNELEKTFEDEGDNMAGPGQTKLSADLK